MTVAGTTEFATLNYQENAGGKGFTVVLDLGPAPTGSPTGYFQVLGAESGGGGSLSAGAGNFNGNFVFNTGVGSVSTGPGAQADNLFNPNGPPYFTPNGGLVLTTTATTGNTTISDIYLGQSGGATLYTGLGVVTLGAPTFFSVTNITPVPCYAAGARLRTPRGDVAVEALAVGDRVVTASGAERPIVWLGHGAVACAVRANPRDAWPVRIAANAFGDNRPARDLFVSPGHAICVDCVGEVLIPASLLVNGATITRTPVDTVDYWHVELESHDILLAEGLPAESYLFMNNRHSFFARDGVGADAPHGVEDFCRPLITASGPVLEAVRAQLAGRAERLGFVRDRDPQLRLIVDGAELAPLSAAGAAVFLLPRDAQDMRLISSTFVPADAVGANGDDRALGLCLHGLTLSDGRTVAHIAPNDARLADGCFPEEGEGGCAWRWTKGELRLPASLLAEFSGASVTLHIACETAAPRGWKAPAEAEARPKARLHAVA